MALLCLILAGGKSTRMGQDKALLYDSVNILSKKLAAKGCRIIVACGSQERAHLFDSECWFDPTNSNSLAEVIGSFVEQYDEEIQLFPCDMYRLDDYAIDVLLTQSPGVPVDVESNEQPTLARIPKHCELPHSMSLHGLFSNLNRNKLKFLGDRLENFNSPNQIDGMNKLNQ
tara:strand:- start:67 stop:582 length:516 start_codon:yes stop_codon:yes gene_type:complete